MDADTIVYGLVTLLLGGACSWLWKTVLGLKERVVVLEALALQRDAETARRFKEGGYESKEILGVVKDLTVKVDGLSQDMAVVKATTARLDRSTKRH